MPFVRLRNMTAIDATGLHALEMCGNVCGNRDERCCHAAPASLLQKTNFIQQIGPENILPHVEAALDRAREVNAAFGGVGAEMAHDFECAAL